MSREVVTMDGEIIEPGNALSVLATAEINQQISTAKRYPRDLRAAARAIQEMATISEPQAALMTYLLKRKDKNGKEVRIEGPSIRFAEIVSQAWGNFRSISRVIDINTKEGYLVAEGVFFDLERNGATSKTHQRSIRGKYGLYVPDMIQMTGNAACSIALRNAILGAVPRAIWQPAFDASQELLRGNSDERINGIEKMFKAFAAGYGIQQARIMESLGVSSADEISVDQLADLRKMYATLKNGEERPETMFPAPGDASHEVVEDPLNDGDAAKNGAAKAADTAKGGKAKGGKGKGAKAEPETEREPGDDGDAMYDENGNPIEA